MKRIILLSACLIFACVAPAQTINFKVINLTGTYTITCKNPIIKLMAVSNHSSAVNYSFVGSAISIPSYTANIPIAGIYTVTAYAAGGLISSQTVAISMNTVVPSATVTPFTQSIVCGGSALISATASPATNITHSVRSPLGGTCYVSQTNMSYTASAPGTYTYQVTENSSGCSYSVTASVTGTGFPTFNLMSPQNFTTGCSTTSNAVVVIAGAVTSPTGGPLSYTLAWPGSGAIPTGSLSTAISYTVNMPGTWTAIVRDDNTGCLVNIPFSILADINPPQIDVYVPTAILDCYTPAMDLQGFSNSPNASYVWKFIGIPPQMSGSTVSISTNTACSTCSLVNTFTFFATDNSNLCSTATVIPIYQNLYPPVASVSCHPSPTLTCANPSISLINISHTGIPPFSFFPSTDSVNVLYWISPLGSTLQASNLFTTQVAGIYTVGVKDLNNGCIAKTSVIIRDGKIPEVQAPPLPFNLCGTPQVIIFPTITSSAAYAFSWASPPGAAVSGVNTASLTTNTPGVYTLTVLDQQNCSKTITVQVLNCVGVKIGTPGNGLLSVSPNPSDGRMTIDFEKSDQVDLTIYTLTGDKIVETVLTEQHSKIDISTYPNGIYFLEISQGRSVSRIKIIKH